MHSSRTSWCRTEYVDKGRRDEPDPENRGSLQPTDPAKRPEAEKHLAVDVVLLDRPEIAAVTGVVAVVPQGEHMRLGDIYPCPIAGPCAARFHVRWIYEQRIEALMPGELVHVTHDIALDMLIILEQMVRSACHPRLLQSVQPCPGLEADVVVLVYRPVRLLRQSVGAAELLLGKELCVSCRSDQDITVFEDDLVAPGKPTALFTKRRSATDPSSLRSMFTKDSVPM